MSQDSGETKSVTVRLRKQVVDALDERAWKNHTDRTKEVQAACDFLIQSITCPNCQTLNDGRSNYCSVCSTPLSESAKEKERCENVLSEIFKHDPLYRDFLERLNLTIETKNYWDLKDGFKS